MISPSIFSSFVCVCVCVYEWLGAAKATSQTRDHDEARGENLSVNTLEMGHIYLQDTTD